MKKIAALALLTLTACSTAPRPIQLPNGTLGYAVDCSGTRSDMADCLNEAATACAGPYTVLNQEQTTTGAVAVAPNVVGAAIRRTMVVSCD